MRFSSRAFRRRRNRRQWLDRQRFFDDDQGNEMRGIKSVSLSLLLTAVASLSACGGGNDDGPPPSYTTQISSDPAYDGDIAETGPGVYVVTQGMTASVQSVFAGIDPATSYEYRTFLDFPLSGQGGVPANALIESAFLDIYANSLQPNTGALPLRIELVAFQPPILLPTDFDRGEQPAIAYIQVNPLIDGTAVGSNISIDVTPLMIQAQQSGLVDFQLRVMEDLGPAIPVLLEINDTTGPNRSNVGPLLTVTYN